MNHRAYLVIVLLLFLINCSSPKPDGYVKSDEQTSQDTFINGALQKANTLNWIDTIVKHYVETTQNPLVNSIRNDTIHGWSYMFDNDTREGKNFITVRIGLQRRGKIQSLMES